MGNHNTAILPPTIENREKQTNKIIINTLIVASIFVFPEEVDRSNTNCFHRPLIVNNFCCSISRAKYVNHGVSCADFGSNRPVGAEPVTQLTNENLDLLLASTCNTTKNY